jgi:hypothetical protein
MVKWLSALCAIWMFVMAYIAYSHSWPLLWMWIVIYIGIGIWDVVMFVLLFGQERQMRKLGIL